MPDAPPAASPQSASPLVRPRPSRPVRFLRRLGLYFLIAYSVWFLASCGLQERLIYPRYLAGPALPDAAVPPEVERLWITTEGDGARTEAWFVPAPGSSAANPAPVAIFFHGNAEFIDHNLSLVERYNARGYSVLMPEFRGYGRSGGSPNQANIVADADAFYGLLTKRRDIDASRIVIHGRSLGTGVAAQLAALHEPKALILESPFTSIARFAWHYGVPPIFLRSPFRTDRVLPNLSCPVLILAGRSDEVIPIHHGQELQRLAKNGTMVELDGSHNSGLSEQGAYWTAIDSVLTKLK